MAYDLDTLQCFDMDIKEEFGDEVLQYFNYDYDKIFENIRINKTKLAFTNKILKLFYKQIEENN